MSNIISLLKKKGFLNEIQMTICNVGSRKLGIHDDYASKGWKIFAPNLTIYGFDADADACEQANAELAQRQIDWTEQHIPLALGKTQGEATLYVTKNPMCSSLYPPNEPYLARFWGLPELSNLDFSIGIETTTLDIFFEQEGIQEIDFLQIDVQGADLDVLKGANRILEQSVLAIQVEVEFSHLYEGQPLFADVDTYLRKQGFTLFDLAPSYRPRARSPIYYSSRPGQILWADAFYFRDLLRDDLVSLPKTPEKLLKLACIADLMKFPDYTLELLEYLTLKYGSDQKFDFLSLIIEVLNQFPQLRENGLDDLPIIQSLRKHEAKTHGSE